MRASLRRIFRIFYQSFFLLLSVVFLALIIITPADAIQQALKNNQPYNVFVIAGCYFLTVVFSALIWTTRWWTNKQALKAIPKTYVPVEKGDVTKKVRKMIVASLTRSATIAWDARPRAENTQPAVVSAPDNRDAFAMPQGADQKVDGGHSSGHSEQEKHDHAITVPPQKPVWGDISHDGWSPPTSADIPDLQFITVILELPHLIEARAVSLAPLDHDFLDGPPIPNSQAVELLQRPASMGLRDYIAHLSGIGVIASEAGPMKFVTSYEYARFSGRPISEPQFQILMREFADVLREMKSPTPSIFEEMGIDDTGSDIDGDATTATTPSTHRSRSMASLRSNASRSIAESSVRSTRRPRQDTSVTPTKNHAFSTAPETPRTQRSGNLIPSSSPSTYFLSQPRPQYTRSLQSSSSSLRSQGSVIKLSQANDNSELPYRLTIPGTRL